MSAFKTISDNVLWVTATGYTLHENENPFYHIVAVGDAPEFKRYRIFCNKDKRNMIVHVLKTLDLGVERKIPIEPKLSGHWRVAFDFIDETPPASQEKTAAKVAENLKQLNFEHTFANKATQSQKFTIDSDSVKKLTYLAQKRKTTKNKLLREIVYTYVQALETTKTLF